MRKATKVLFIALMCSAGLAQAHAAPSLKLDCTIADNSGITYGGAEIASGTSAFIDFKNSKYSGSVSFTGKIIGGVNHLTVVAIDSKDAKSASESLTLVANGFEAGAQLVTRHVKMNDSTNETTELNCTVKSISNQ